MGKRGGDVRWCVRVFLCIALSIGGGARVLAQTVPQRFILACEIYEEVDLFRNNNPPVRLRDLFIQIHLDEMKYAIFLADDSGGLKPSRRDSNDILSADSNGIVLRQVRTRSIESIEGIELPSRRYISEFYDNGSLQSATRGACAIVQ
jgi:hypothetical protein